LIREKGRGGFVIGVRRGEDGRCVGFFVGRGGGGIDLRVEKMLMEEINGGKGRGS
jgi:hypothetical protein